MTASISPPSSHQCPGGVPIVIAAKKLNGDLGFVILVDLKYHFGTYSKLVNGSWYGSIVLLMFSLSVPRGWDRCQVTGAACGSHPGSSAMSRSQVTFWHLLKAC